MKTQFEPWKGRTIAAVVGHYGSGKTEFSLNLALAARRAGKNVTIADLDIVNPFFRTAEHRDVLEANGVKLIAPPYAGSAVDLPVLSADVLALFEQGENDYAILDVGGDDAGAAALGRFRPQFIGHPADLYYVVNPYRPFSETREQIADMMRRIAQRARMRVTGLIANANLGEMTGEAEITHGMALLRDVSAFTGVPVCCACVPDWLTPPDVGAPVFPIRRMLVPDWLEG